jgi:hypothetical protein
MGDIYRNCERCLVWLGGEDSSGKAGDFLHTLGRELASYCHHLNRAGYTENNKVEMVNEYIVTIRRAYRDKFRTEEFGEHWMDVIKLLRSP